ncbi:MAG: HDIG domain-containing protein [Bacteroidota bacterium]|nr:HDIG domain-containing protein [Bacteroidota bacterium]
MKQLLELLKKYYNGIIKTLILLGAVLIIVYLFPGESKFKYEFSKGKPWMHEDMIAEYNFPIYKTDAELTSERDSILKEYKPYFRLDTNILHKQEERFIASFDLEWKKYLLDEYHLTEPLNELNRKQRRLIIAKENYLDFGQDLLKFVYSKGIVEVTDILDQVDNENLSIVIMIGNMAQDYDYSEVFTQKSAYEYVVTRVEDYKWDDKAEKTSDLLKTLNFNNFIQFNLFYDIETSNNEKQSLIDEISLTSGMVQRGERIISRGEVVSQNKFRVLESLKREYETRSGSTGNFFLIVLGQFLLVAVSLIMLFLFLYNFRREIYNNNLHTFFIVLLIVLFEIIIFLTMKTGIISFYFIPIVILPIIIRVFFDSRLALFIYFILLMLAGFQAPNSFEFIFLSFNAGVVAIFSITNIYKRGILFFTSFLVASTYSILYLGFVIIQESDLHNVEWINFIWFAGNGFLILLSYPLIYVFEKVFGFLSDATLMELSDTNQSLLRELADKAPGTFQHSLQVGNLAEDAIRTIGGNPLLVRTAALYHDVGKISDPLYFIENQSAGFNPHDSLSFEESASKIIGHVEMGIQIAHKGNLPSQLLDFIRTHHGTTKVQYFYRSYLKNYPDELVDDEMFSYPGPKPFSKEMAILMMADSVEAASRSLKKIDHENIKDLVDKIIDSQLLEGQFNDSPITLVEINKVKQIFRKRLANIYHVRIEYPDEVKK